MIKATKQTKYTEEEKEWFVANFDKYYYYDEIAEAWAERFDVERSVHGLKHLARRMGLKKTERKSMFTPEADQYIVENCCSYSAVLLAEQLREKFGIAVTPNGLSHHMRIKLGIKRGVGFHAENFNENWALPIGSERVRSGKLYVKVDKDEWVAKSHTIVEYDPAKQQVLYLDGNPLNVTKENIIVVSMPVYARLAKNGWLKSGEDVLKAGIAWSELLYALKEFE